ncbi:MAG: hypothetical protein HOM28_00790 [Rhodospirillales bacterium]|nr:hypothetical protein [Rhodospirillales bacterium]
MKCPRSKLQEKVAACSSNVFSPSQGIQQAQGEKHPNADLHPTYIVGGISVSHPTAIKFKTAENIVQAAGFASAMGLPLEYHLTVRWSDKSSSHHYELLRKIADWQRYNIGKAVYVWSREAKGGHHSHILLHIPRSLSAKFRKLVVLWLKQSAGSRSLSKGTISFTRHRGMGNPFSHIRNRVRYILKGAGADTRLLIGARKAEQTNIKGKRAGTSQALGVEARRTAGSVLPCGLRQPTEEMLIAARLRDALNAESDVRRTFPKHSCGQEGPNEALIIQLKPATSVVA